MIEIVQSPAGEEVSLLTTRRRAFLGDASRMIPHEASPAVNAVDGTLPPSLIFVWKGGVEHAVFSITVNFGYCALNLLMSLEASLSLRGDVTSWTATSSRFLASMSSVVTPTQLSMRRMIDMLYHQY